MKTKTALLFLLILCLLFVSCSNQSPSQAPKTPIESLTEEEKMVFDAIIKISNEEHFSDPTATRLLEIGDYLEYHNDEFAIFGDHIAYHTYYAKVGGFGTFQLHDHLGDGVHHSVVIRIQHSDKIGNTKNHYVYSVRLKTIPESILKDSQEVSEAVRKVWNEPPKYTSYRYPTEKFDSFTEFEEYYKNYHCCPYCTADYANEQTSRFNYLDSDRDYTIEKSAESSFDIAKINKTLKYYWDERLGND